MRAMMIRLPVERGMQLAAFADEHSLTYGEAIGILLDHGAKTGLGNSLALPGIGITAVGDLIGVAIDGFALIPLTVAQAESFAAGLQKAATTPGVAILDLDMPDTITLSRKGAGVVVSVSRAGETKFQRVFACGVAKAMAERIHDAAIRAGTFNAFMADLGDLP
ncbi:MAG TPA: hypothetical protein VK749_12040 [Xanthobacteraceae bacterium]|nr:hypothetical protein [Xanthobacteraceae bacterium]